MLKSLAPEVNEDLVKTKLPLIFPNLFPGLDNACSDGVKEVILCACSRSHVTVLRDVSQRPYYGKRNEYKRCPI